MSTECYPITILPHMSQLYRDYLAMAERRGGCAGAAVVWGGAVWRAVDGAGGG